MLNVTSLAAIRLSVNYSIYNFVKAGLNLLTKSVVKEFGLYNISANVFAQVQF